MNVIANMYYDLDQTDIIVSSLNIEQLFYENDENLVAKQQMIEQKRYEEYFYVMQQLKVLNEDDMLIYE